MRHWKQIIKDLSIRKKLLLCFGFTSLLLLISNLVLYKEVNRSINRIDQIYVSNITLNDLSDALTSTHEEVYEYLSTKSSSALENYYRSGQQFRDLLEDLNGGNPGTTVCFCWRKILKTCQIRIWLQRIIR